MRHHDLLIIGAGSGNTILDPRFDGWDVGIVERDTFGGTCLNRGCIPSKMLVHAADVAQSARRGPSLGVHSHVGGVDWPAVRDRVFGRIDPIAAAGEHYRHGLDNVTVHRGSARFTGDRTVAVGSEVVTADHVVLAAGARPHIPAIPGLSETVFDTSDTIMRTDRVPEHLVVIGGGFIAAELAHVFGAFGARVTILTRGESMLRHEDDDIRVAVTDAYRARFEVHCASRVRSVRGGPGSYELDVVAERGAHRVAGDALLVAAGRIPNGDEIAAPVTGAHLDPDGFVVADLYRRTTAPGVWALGDVCNPEMLKHTANADARIIAHNLLHPGELRPVDRRVIPHAVFGDPQVAAVGATERELRDGGIAHVVSVQRYGDTAFGWAMEDTTSICKVIACPRTRLLLGAHLMGPHAATLLQPLVQAMQFAQTVDEVARGAYYIHPALTEVVEQALLGL